MNTRVGRGQDVDRVYWNVSLTALGRIPDVVRTNLVELVAEMRAGMRPGDLLPTPEVADQAFGVAIHGNKNRIVNNFMLGGSGNTAVGSLGPASAGAPSESKSRARMRWIVGIVTILGAARSIAGAVFALR